MSCILVGGGNRSGKSAFALEYARRFKEPLAFIATAQAFDDEMRTRIQKHRSERGPEFVTIEESMNPARSIDEAGDRFGAIVLDCLTLWLSNLMLAEGHVGRESAELLRACLSSPATVVLVTNEVGCGIVPENELARRFRDAAGRLNQQIAASASEVYWMVFGVPLRVK